MFQLKNYFFSTYLFAAGWEPARNFKSVSSVYCFLVYSRTDRSGAIVSEGRAFFGAGRESQTGTAKYFLYAKKGNLLPRASTKITFCFFS